MQKHTTRRLLSIVLTTMLALGTVSTAFAAGGGPASGTLTGSEAVTESDGGAFSFATKAIGATDSTSPMALALTVDDLTGTGDGWTLSMSMTQFACTTGGCTGKTLPTTSVMNVTAACVTDAACTLPNNSATCNVAANTVEADVTSSFTICDPATGTGMGSTLVTPTLAIPVLATAYAGVYDSTVTITIVGGGV